MPDSTTVLLFVAATAALFAIPGPSVMYIITRSVSQGRAAGLVSVLGMHTGTIPYVLASAFGLSALLTASSTAFTVIQYLGAGYLIWLGVGKLRSLRAGAELELEKVPLRRVYGQAVVVSVLNPKTLIFFTAFLPQFVDPARGAVLFQVLFFCAGFLVLGVLSDGTYALLASALSAKLRRPANRRKLDTSSGIVYLVLGALAAAVPHS
ncbi:Threonine/homoserine/homoserine lactone efflux protein [Lentzea xinjiangensis]|uniref:Threonine/homoserine/homoserine lactone efflux protein n=1 Tax=Lentzea xinjiangensis TaxID=402600 RepID=A0A1H9V0W5_9PSEU|nr:LysE family translocator [Lentzea xinjiangensis]SES15239.1 Threonine/homoserine/homoserine lactone efflux protein [Lentzea xinjiangensis]